MFYYNHYPYYTYYLKRNHCSPKIYNSYSNNLVNNLSDSNSANYNDNENNSNVENFNGTQKRSYKYNNNFAHINLESLFNSDLEHPIVEFLGIKLYLDDLIILGLLFFLYKEDVHDEILFCILLLLLIS